MSDETFSEFTRRLESLAAAGITVSICCGPTRGTTGWSVLATGPYGDEFDRPFAASDPEHAVSIAEIEAVERGWVQPT